MARNKKSNKSDKIILNPGVSIGEPAAEEDGRYLARCFVEHPMIDALTNVESPQSLLVGRTGTGKSAILLHIEEAYEGVTRIDPRDMAFHYIGNSAIINYLEDAGANLDTLYKYLWMHIITLHIAREYLSASSENQIQVVMRRVQNLVMPDAKKRVVLEYLEKYADTFFLDVEAISAEVTEGLYLHLAASLNVSVQYLKSKIEAGHQWKREETRQIKFRAQDFVNSLQIKELKETINALSNLIDRQRPCYVLIDDLDQCISGNVDTQYQLIRALINSLKTFRRMQNVKIIIAMREDLLQSTIRSTTDPLFQAEKMQGIIRRMNWSEQLLFEVVDRRVKELYRFHYTKRQVSFNDIFPEKIGSEIAKSYIIHHTLQRPRDLIAFVNKILAENEGASLPLVARAVTKAESSYSFDRQRALEDEWRSYHPLIKSYLSTLHGLRGLTPIDQIDEDRLTDIICEVDELDRAPVDDVERVAKSVFKRNKSQRIRRLAHSLIGCLYKTGAVGVKINNNSARMFADCGHSILSDAEVSQITHFIVHPMLRSALGCGIASKKAA